MAIMRTPEMLEKARLMISAITTELERGVKHYDIHDKPLTTVKEILQALRRDGEVILKFPDGYNHNKSL